MTETGFMRAMRSAKAGFAQLVVVSSTHARHSLLFREPSTGNERSSC